MGQLKNVGAMNNRQLEAILRQFPPKAVVERGELFTSVKVMGGMIMSAARIGGFWHVRAIPNLITPA